MKRWTKDTDGLYKTDLTSSISYRGIVTEKNGKFYGTVATFCDSTKYVKVGKSFASLATAKKHVLDKMQKLEGFFY